MGYRHCGHDAGGEAAVIYIPRRGLRRIGRGPGVVPVPPSGDGPFFEDSFAGLQRNNANGFTWAELPAGDVTVVSFDGHNCLRFRYPAEDPGVDGQAEQRFGFGRDLNAMSMEFYLHVPSNFTMREHGNNKFFRGWRDNYSDTAAGVQEPGLEFVTYNSLGHPQPSTTAYARPLWRDVLTHGLITDLEIEGHLDPMIGPGGPINIGAWNRVRIAWQGSSGFGVYDGAYRVWFNETRLTNGTALPLFNRYETPSDVVLKQAYIMGYANTGYGVQTDFHVRDFKVWDRFNVWE